MPRPRVFSFFFFNDTATTEIYTLSLHDALPISVVAIAVADVGVGGRRRRMAHARGGDGAHGATLGLGQLQQRSEEHTSELQSRPHLVCRLLLEKKKEHGVPERIARGDLPDRRAR